MILTFGEFELDFDRFELRRNGQPCKVEPKVFDLLVHFARNPGHVFSRDDLIAAVWPNRVVSDAAVSTCIKSARKALDDSGDWRRSKKHIGDPGGGDIQFRRPGDHRDVNHCLRGRVGSAVDTGQLLSTKER